MFDTPDILNLHLFIRAAHIFVNMSSHRYAVEDRSASAVAHLAHARSQNSGTGILGILVNDRATLWLLFFM